MNKISESDGDASVLLREDLGRDADDYGPSAGGKKRKVPAFAVAHQLDVADPQGDATRSTAKPVSAPPKTAQWFSPRSPSLRAQMANKTLFLQRKAALITLYLDAQHAVIQGLIRPGVTKPSIPDIPDFERLLPSLQDLGVGDWQPDNPGWRSMSEIDYEGRDKLGFGIGIKGIRWTGKEKWKCQFEKRKRAVHERKEIIRGGWMPEQSFELDIPTKATDLIRQRKKDQAAVRKLAFDLRALVLSSGRTTAPLKTSSSTDNSNASPLAPTTAVTTPEKKTTPSSTLLKPELALTRNVSRDSIPVPASESNGSEETSKKKKPKKKKRSVLANQANPHHVNNYRPTRMIADNSDQPDIYALMSSLLFPSPTKFLAARPKRKTANLPGTNSSIPPVNPTSTAIPPNSKVDEEYVCCFCEHALFYSTEAARKRAIKDRKKELRRKEKIQARAKDVIEGRRRNEEGEDEDWDDECDEDEDEARYGKCTCGRAIGDHKHRSIKDRLKPPEPDPPDPTA